MAKTVMEKAKFIQKVDGIMQDMRGKAEKDINNLT